MLCESISDVRDIRSIAVRYVQDFTKRISVTCGSVVVQWLCFGLLVYLA